MIALDRAIRALPREPRAGAPPPKLEIEEFPDGRRREIATVFVRNGECPLACVYCALYRQANDRPASGSEVAEQIFAVRRRFPDAAGLKLYNASSFFEPRSIDQSEASLREIAGALSGLDLVVVEARSENAFLAERLLRHLSGPLEVAIGLETEDDGLLRLLNKPTSTAQFRKAAAALRSIGASLRAFVLVGPPFVPAAEIRKLAVAAFREARREQSRVVSLLPVVSQHEPMESLRRAGYFSEVSLDEYYATVRECAAIDAGSARHGTVLLAETEHLPLLPGCPRCRAERERALAAFNETGRLGPPSCAGHGPREAPGARPERRPDAREVAAALTRPADA